MAWWMWSTKEYLDYNTYKSKISSIWDTIWDEIWDKIDLDVDYQVDDLDDELDVDEKLYDNNEKGVEIDNKEDSSKRTIKAFPKSVKFIDIPRLNGWNKSENKSDNYWALTWYSKSDLIWVINKYIEKNLDDDTDILVTVEYENDSSDPQKIILQTQKKPTWEKISSTVSWDLLDKIFNEVHWEEFEDDENVDVDEIENALDENVSIDDSNNQMQNMAQPVKKTTSTKLTKEEQEEAEEILDLLF